LPFFAISKNHNIDPQDRGDLYLLAPMRLLLSPIAEETEAAEAPSHVTEAVANDFNKYAHNFSGRQGCQIFSPQYVYKNKNQYTKLPQHYQIAQIYTQWP
jgi:hypothetical protein